MVSTQTTSPIELAKKIRRYKELASTNKLLFYKPYAKQREFHAVGADMAERCMGAGNQLGKTWCGSMEAAYHVTGLYPDWWEGLRFDKPITMWVCGVSGKDIRGSTQKLLIGRIEKPEEFGTGSIPKHLILDHVKALGTKDLCDHVKIKHISGGTSLIFFKSYEQGRASFQSETLDLIWFDEEPPPEIYSEGLTRTNKGQKGQRAMLTFTPLLGVTEVVRKFYEEPSAHQHLTMMTIWDVDHYSKEEKQQIIDSYPPHERDARSKGIPTMGSGRVFPISEDDIKVEPFRIPAYWPRIKGLDFGTDHPTALACCAWDRDNDVFYVYDEYTARAEMATPSFFAPACNRKLSWIPIAWPHDGLQHDKGSYEQLAQQYADAGMEMLPDKATFEDGGNGVEAGIMDMLDRMKTGRWKVFSNCIQWLEEFRLYHRKDGKIVKVRDDLISASRYALMMKRYAEVEEYEYEERQTRDVGVMGY